MNKPVDFGSMSREELIDFVHGKTNGNLRGSVTKFEDPFETLQEMMEQGDEVTRQKTLLDDHYSIVRHAENCGVEIFTQMPTVGSGKRKCVCGYQHRVKNSPAIIFYTKYRFFHPEIESIGFTSLSL